MLMSGIFIRPFYIVCRRPLAPQVDTKCTRWCYSGARTRIHSGFRPGGINCGASAVSLPRHCRKIRAARNQACAHVRAVANVTSKDQKSHRPVMRAILNRTVITRLHCGSIFVNLLETRNVMQNRKDDFAQ